MEREDSGVIDLFALHEKATAKVSEVPAEATLSAPVPALAVDLGGDDDLGDGPFPPKSRTKHVLIALGGGAAVVVIGLFVGFEFRSSNGSEVGKRTATTTVSAPPAVATNLPRAPSEPPPLPASTPAAAQALTQASAPAPAPPTTGAPVRASAPRSNAGASRPAPSLKSHPSPVTGVKMIKVQSAGVP